MEKKAEDILEVIMAYARLEFDRKIEVEAGDNDVLAAVATGVNMLGEELETKAISLKEKDQLLKEIHHRVKNNMQIVISMLNLQMISEENERLRSVVEDLKSRINAMALVHELLYRAENQKHTRLADYVEFLSRSLFLSFAPPRHEIRLEQSVDPSIYLDIDHMIPVGLILNEMITNSLKHAFPEKRGKISIEVTADQGKIKLHYSDNGKGLPKTFSIDDAETLGVQLIFLLTEQLNGNTEVVRENGLTYALEF